MDEFICDTCGEPAIGWVQDIKRFSRLREFPVIQIRADGEPRRCCEAHSESRVTDLGIIDALTPRS